MLRIIWIIVFGFHFQFLMPQALGKIKGTITSNGQVLPFVTVGLKNTTYGTVSNTNGYFEINNIPAGTYEIMVSTIGYEKQSKKFVISESLLEVMLSFDLKEIQTNLNEVVVSGTMKEISKTESPVPVEVYTPTLFKKIQLLIFSMLYKM